ncbi:MAG: hypothetical protein P857_75 [Candidatus Xenolissoclinum pacificiensis L6]|uniref:Uncharacterized protein n=1 Tax=Candidatus Xenolissoclinum pacificiensis L6 TaxID=1401685 RepID=W2UZU2_9RICK|nr:MAG: hypothetical protein P857_75 [Candidatus Xenolissoclinum pacificiensis L6]
MSVITVVPLISSIKSSALVISFLFPLIIVNHVLPNASTIAVNPP